MLIVRRQLILNTLIKLTNEFGNAALLDATGWSGSNASVAATAGVLSFTPSGASAYPAAIYNTTVPVAVGKRLYCRAGMLISVSGATSMTLNVDGSTAGDNQNATKTSPSPTVWYTVSEVATQPANVAGVVSIKLYNDFPDAATANGKTGQITLPLLIDISKLPNKYQAMSDAALKTLFDNLAWFSGTKAVKL